MRKTHYNWEEVTGPPINMKGPERQFVPACTPDVQTSILLLYLVSVAVECPCTAITGTGNRFLVSRELFTSDTGQRHIRD